MTENDIPEDVDRALSEIERQIRVARGEHIERTPWDFRIPTSNELRQLRNAAGLSIRQVAEETGYAENTIRKYESAEQPPGRKFITMVLRLYKREWPRHD